MQMTAFILALLTELGTGAALTEMDDLAAIRRLAEAAPKDGRCPAAGGEDVRYYTGIAHEPHILRPVGFAYGADCTRPPDGRACFEFHYDAAGRLTAIVERTATGERSLTSRLVYKGDEVIARLWFSPRGFELGDYGVWRSGRLVMIGRVMADGKLISHSRCTKPAPK